MLVGNDAYEKFIYYIENNINFDFLSHIPGSDDAAEIQRESIINLIKRSNNNESFWIIYHIPIQYLKMI